MVIICSIISTFAVSNLKSENAEKQAKNRGFGNHSADLRHRAEDRFPHLVPTRFQLHHGGLCEPPRIHALGVMSHHRRRHADDLLDFLFGAAAFQQHDHRVLAQPVKHRSGVLEGTAYPGTSTLARDTDISEDTVVKRLRWLAEIGAIALFKCWRDENGQRNYEGRGKPTSSEIRFLFDADVEEIRARAHGEIVGDNARETYEISPRPQRGLNEDVQPPASPRLAPD